MLLHFNYLFKVLDQLTGCYLIKKCPTFHGKCMFIFKFSRPQHPSLSWITNFILSSSLCLRLPSRLFLCNPPAVLSSSLPSTCPAHLLHWITQIIFSKDYGTLSSSSCIFLHTSVKLSCFVLNIILSSLFSNTLSLRSSLNLKDQLSHPYKTTGKF